MLDWLLKFVGARLAWFLEKRVRGYETYTPSDPDTLEAIMRPGDILLVEGDQRLSAAIKYLTQSTWSHAAIHVGDALGTPEDGSEPKRLVEVSLKYGAAAVPLSKYRSFNTRICRPVNLSEEDLRTVIDFVVSRLGIEYDLKNIFDLARYLLPTPPVPVRYRRRMLALGSGDPTRAICSTLIALAFQEVRYPILPLVETAQGKRRALGSYSPSEILHIRHHSLFTPRDFDLSPYFAVIKPTLEGGFDYKTLVWGDSGDDPARGEET